MPQQRMLGSMPMLKPSVLMPRIEKIDAGLGSEAMTLVAPLVEPLVAALRRYVLAGDKVHADDTPLPVLAPGEGQTKTARLWTYVRDDRPAGPSFLHRVHALCDTEKERIPPEYGSDFCLASNPVQKRDNTRIGSDTLSNFFEGGGKPLVFDGDQNKIGRAVLFARNDITEITQLIISVNAFAFIS